jgi:enterobactin synthetase component D
VTGRPGGPALLDDGKMPAMSKPIDEGMLTGPVCALLPAGADALRTLLREAPHPASPGLAGAAIDLQALAAALDLAGLAGRLPAGIARSVPKRQLAFVAGRLCAEHALRLAGGAGAVGRGGAGEPLWPDGFLGSITHTDDLACAVAALGDGARNRRGVGIDSQALADEASVDAIVSVCCTARERALLNDGRPPRERFLAATVVFALKEAFYKAVHPSVGRFVEFDELEVSAIGIDAAGEGRATLRPALRELPPGHALTGRFVLEGDAVHALVEWPGDFSAGPPPRSAR